MPRNGPRRGTRQRRPNRTNLALVVALAVAPPCFITGCGDADGPYETSVARSPAPAVSLDAAIVQGDDEAVRAHILAGTPIDTPNASGDTPLSLASVFGRAYACRVLIDAGADLESRNNSGTTPLFNAAFFCHPEIVRMLIEAGADTETTDANGVSIASIMETPWAQIEPVYAAVYGAIGIPLDTEQIRSIRPEIAAMLR